MCNSNNNSTFLYMPTNAGGQQIHTDYCNKKGKQQQLPPAALRIVVEQLKCVIIVELVCCRLQLPCFFCCRTFSLLSAHAACWCALLPTLSLFYRFVADLFYTFFLTRSAFSFSLSTQVLLLAIRLVAITFIATGRWSTS